MPSRLICQNGDAKSTVLRLTSSGSSCNRLGIPPELTPAVIRKKAR
jgi:hypothetical protein